MRIDALPAACPRCTAAVSCPRCGARDVQSIECPACRGLTLGLCRRCGHEACRDVLCELRAEQLAFRRTVSAILRAMAAVLVMMVAFPGPLKEATLRGEARPEPTAPASESPVAAAKLAEADATVKMGAAARRVRMSEPPAAAPVAAVPAAAVEVPPQGRLVAMPPVATVPPVPFKPAAGPVPAPVPLLPVAATGGPGGPYRVVAGNVRESGELSGGQVDGGDGWRVPAGSDQALDLRNPRIAALEQTALRARRRRRLAQLSGDGDADPADASIAVSTGVPGPAAGVAAVPLPEFAPARKSAARRPIVLSTASPPPPPPEATSPARPPVAQAASVPEDWTARVQGVVHEALAAGDSLGGVALKGSQASALLAYWVYRRVGMRGVPPLAETQMQAGERLEPLGYQPWVGDLLFFSNGRPWHIGVCFDAVRNKFLTVDPVRGGAIVADLDAPAWRAKFVCARRILKR